MTLDNPNPYLYKKEKTKKKKKNKNYSLGQIHSQHNIVLDFFNMKKKGKSR